MGKISYYSNTIPMNPADRLQIGSLEATATVLRRRCCRWRRGHPTNYISVGGRISVGDPYAPSPS